MNQWIKTTLPCLCVLETGLWIHRVERDAQDGRHWDFVGLRKKVQMSQHLLHAHVLIWPWRQALLLERKILPNELPETETSKLPTMSNYGLFGKTSEAFRSLDFGRIILNLFMFKNTAGAQAPIRLHFRTTGVRTCQLSWKLRVSERHWQKWEDIACPGIPNKYFLCLFGVLYRDSLSPKSPSWTSGLSVFSVFLVFSHIQKRDSMPIKETISYLPSLCHVLSLPRPKCLAACRCVSRCHEGQEVQSQSPYPCLEW